MGDGVAHSEDGAPDLPPIAIHGIEATQAIQVHEPCGVLPGASAPKPAVPLIRDRPLVIRVYPDYRGAPSRGAPPAVDGEILFRDVAAGGAWLPAPRFPGCVEARSARAIDRTDPTHTLNFRIGGEHTRGALDLRARLWLQGPGGIRIESEEVHRTLTFAQTRRLRLRIHAVRSRRDGVELPVPSALDALETLAFVRKTYPVSSVEVVHLDTLDAGEDLEARPDAGEDRIWRVLLVLLERLRLAGGGSEIHYALLPRDAPAGHVGGYGSALGIGASRVGDGSAMAHEIGHALGRIHAPGGGGEVDPEYPLYRGYPLGSIGEAGVDCTTGEVHSPATTRDFMSESRRYWVSPYTYGELLSLFEGPDAERSSPLVEQVYLSLTRRPDHGVMVHHAVTMPGRPLESWGRQSICELELRDEGDRVLSARTVAGCRAVGAGRHGGLPILASLPYHRAAHRLVVRSCDCHPPATYEIPQGEPRVEITSSGSIPRDRPAEGRIELRWTATAPADADRIAAFLRYSSDGGASWRSLGAGLEWGRSSVDLDDLPGGEDCRLQVVVSTLIRTAVAETPPFRVRRKPRRAMVAGGGGPRVHAGPFLELLGTAHSPEGFAQEGDLLWSSSLQGPLGAGSCVVVDDPLPGEHVVTLSAPDGLGGRTEARAVIRIIPLATAGAPEEEVATT